ncbi:transcriptional adapter 3-like [Bolinopsis microptera]|uniref:transcriptional adapter 3-like n=1 Tax=Bolinopsis microptera TaxID=2820187 RepID=UPI0030793E74
MTEHTIPNLLDYNKSCQAFSSVLSRHRESYVKTEEISKLQSDLERLLADAEKRLAWLQSENEGIDSSDKGISSDSSDSQCTSSNSPKHKAGCKRGPGRPQVNDRIKNMKLSSRLFKNKVKKPEQPPVDKAPPIISDRPHQFWQSLDAWCSDITSDDMDSLQELLKSQDYDDEYFKVPALGTHYSQRWAMEDLLAEQREGSEPHGRNNEISNITPATIAQLDNKPGNANKTLGPLTEKLLSALIEEGVCSRSGDDLDEIEEITSPKNEPGTSSLTTSHVESRVREELIQLGILDDSEGESEDEVLSELLSKQQELRDLVDYNRTQLGLLYDTALMHMKQQDIRHKIDEIDEEVCDTYRNFMLKKHKKIPYNKKEKEQANKLLQNREELNKMLMENSFLT